MLGENNRLNILLSSVYGLVLLVFVIYMARMDIYPFPQLEIGSPTFHSIAVYLLLMSIPSFWAPIDLSKPSSTVYWILYLLVYLPSVLMLFTINNISVQSVLFFVSIMTSMYILSRIKKINILIKPQASIRFQDLSVLLIVFVFILAILYLRLGFLTAENLQYLSLNGVYEIRERFATVALDYGIATRRITAILTSGLLYVVSPWLFVIGIMRNKKMYAFVGVVGWVCIFLIAGYRSAIMLPIGIFGFYATRILVKDGIKAMIGGLSFAIISSILVHYLLGIEYYPSFVRRFLLTPGINTALYFDFFSQNQPIYYFSRTLGFYPYDNPDITSLMMQEYYGNEGSLNANLWASEFARLLYVGPIFATSILTGIFIFIDSFSTEINSDLVSLLILAFSIPLINSSILQLILTHGIVGLLLLTYIHPNWE
jgi:hypothetical protein